MITMKENGDVSERSRGQQHYSTSSLCQRILDGCSVWLIANTRRRRGHRWQMSRSDVSLWSTLSPQLQEKFNFTSGSGPGA
jgi:hypothetical protein